MSNTSKLGPELNALLERGEISPEAYAEYAATADLGSTATAGNGAGAAGPPARRKSSTPRRRLSRAVARAMAARATADSKSISPFRPR